MGIAIADLLVAGIGTGTWQVGVVTGLAMLAATLVGGGTLLASQAGASAVLVATLQPPEGFDFDRSLDALVGSGTALVVGALLLPVDPVRLVREGLGPVLDRLAAALLQASPTRSSSATSARRSGRSRRCRGSTRSTTTSTATLAAAGDAARISLSRRGKLGRLERYVAAVGEIGLAIENTRALARGVGARDRARRLDPAGGGRRDPRARHGRARARRRCSRTDDAEPSREAALRAVRLANAVLDETANLSAVHIVGQVRLVAVDLLRAGGVPRPEAQEAVRCG